MQEVFLHILDFRKKTLSINLN